MKRRIVAGVGAAVGVGAATGVGSATLEGPALEAWNSSEKQRQGSRDGAKKRAEQFVLRNREMAQLFHVRRPSSNLSDTALMADIGAKRGLRRRQAIEAVKQ